MKFGFSAEIPSEMCEFVKSFPNPLTLVEISEGIVGWIDAEIAERFFDVICQGIVEGNSYGNFQMIYSNICRKNIQKNFWTKSLRNCRVNS